MTVTIYKNKLIILIAAATKAVAEEEDIEIPEQFKQNYNFLNANAKSLTTLFNNYIQRKVSHDTLLRQFQASQENTFLTMRSRVHINRIIEENSSTNESLEIPDTQTVASGKSQCKLSDDEASVASS